MGVFVSLYRGINVGGRHSVKMESLRALHERLGHCDVNSYIQSGNVVFGAKGSQASNARTLAAEFTKEFGFESHVLVLSARDLTTIVEDNPYARIAARNPKLVHAGICDGKPDAPALHDLLSKFDSDDEFTIRGRVIYLHAPNGVGKSKFVAGMERACGVPVTLRNWRTVEALQQMATFVAAGPSTSVASGPSTEPRG